MYLLRRRRTPRPRTLAGMALVALLAGVGLVAAGAAPASAADGDVSWAVRTAANNFGSERQNYSYALDPGGSLQDALVVVNHGSAPIDLAVYAADGFTSAAGQLDLAAGDAQPAAIGSWVHASASTVRVPPGESVDVPFTLALPDNAPPGDYLGGIVTSLTSLDATAGFNVDRRLAVRIRLRVGGDLAPGLSVENLTVQYGGTANPLAKGEANVSYTIRNTGNVILSARQDVAISGPFGRLRVQGDAPADSPVLLPGDTWAVSVPIDGVAPALRLSAAVTLTPLLTDAVGTTTALSAVKASAGAWAIPWTLLLLVITLGAGAAAGLVLARRRRAQAKAREDARVESAIEAALRERDEVAS